MGNKGRGRGGGGMRMPMQGGGSSMMQRVQQLQAEMQRAQEELAAATVEASVGGGAVKVVMTGQQEVQSVTIDPAAVSADEVEMLQDLIVAAFNEALRKSRELAEQKMAPLTSGLNIPGLM